MDRTDANDDKTTRSESQQKAPTAGAQRLHVFRDYGATEGCSGRAAPWDDIEFYCALYNCDAVQSWVVSQFEIYPVSTRRSSRSA